MRPEHWLYTIPLRLRSLFRWGQADRELDDELRDHLERKAEEYAAQGMTQQEARRRARLDLGGMEKVKEECRDVRRVNWIQDFLEDLRYGVRTLRKSSAFTAVAVLSLAIGIGANTAVFSIVNAVLLRPLPYQNPDRLVMLWELDRKGNESFVAPADFQDWRRQNRSFEHIAAFIHTSFSISGEDAAERVAGDVVSADLFEVLRVAPVLGRRFVTEDEREVPYQSVIISYALWQRRFGGDPGVIGKFLESNGRKLTVIGVMPKGFDFPAGLIRTPPELWVPMARPPQEWNVRGFHYLRVVGRLRDEVSTQRAADEMNALQRRIADQNPGEAFAGVRTLRLSNDIVGDVKTPLLVIFAAVLFVLLIACANVANLTLARSSARRREIAVRSALGAGRWRITKQLVTESLLLGILGGILGIAFAIVMTKGILVIAPANVPRLAGVRIDSGVLEFTLAVSILVGLLSGISPAIVLSGGDVNAQLKSSGHGSSHPEGGRLRNVLVVSEIALAIVLVVGGGLMAQSLYRLEQVRPGFRSENILTFLISVPEARYPTGRQAFFFSDLMSRISNLPGVESVGGTSALPLSGTDETYSFEIESQRRSGGQASMGAHYRIATPNYFSTLGIPLVRGRVFDEHDTATSPRVIVINESLARQYFPNVDPLGKRIEIGNGRNAGPSEVIGIAKDLRHSSLAEKPTPEMYESYLQAPTSTLTLVVRAAANPRGLLPEIHQQLGLLDPSIPLSKVLTMSDLMDESLAPSFFRSALLGGFALFAMVLAALGVYGVMAYNLSRRIAEIGIRIALGARPHQIMSLVIKQAVKLSITGVVTGSLAAVWLTRFLKALLFGVGTTDLATFAAAGLILVGVAICASYLPARRAMNLDPLVALRHE